MKEIKCLCKRIIPKEDHTGLCQLDHFIAYTGNGEHGFDSVELRRIVNVIALEAKESSTSCEHAFGCAYFIKGEPQF